MSKVLVTFEKNWADEFDIYGFAVLEKAEWENAIESFKNATKYESYYFGTNEGWDPDQIEEEKDDWIDAWTAKDITDEEAAILLKLFPSYRKKVDYGDFISPKELVGE